ncbi:MAG: T9SS type A sorting domain-containing protein [Bacteroidetes bacterium]|nr:T9SS type A sorting domain-containing protein [Bacteroidota bacterium]
MPQCTTGNANGCYVYLNGGPDQSTCIGQSITTAAADSGTWTALGSNPSVVTITQPSAPTTSIGPFPISGTYGFVWTTAVGSITMTVTVYPAPVAEAGPDVTLCRPGTLTLGGAPTASGGSGTFQYRWWPLYLGISSLYVPNPTVHSAAGVSQVFEIRVTDSLSGCVSIDTMLLTTAPQIAVIIDASADTILSGQTTMLTARSLLAGGSYLWSPTGSLSPVSGISDTEYASPTVSQTYSVIYAVNGCEDTAYKNIVVLPSVSAGPDRSTCMGQQIITAAAGIGTWAAQNGNPGTCTIANPLSAFTAIVNFSSPGIYKFVWAGTNNSDTMQVMVNGNPSVTVTTTDAQCYGQNTGSICASVSGGNAPYTYQWTNSPPLTASCVNNIVAGAYGVTVTSGDGCTASAGGTVSQPASSFAVSVTHTDILCYGNSTGTITLTGSGGTYPYSTAAWSDGDTGIVRTGMAAGTYTYTIADANGCQQTGPVTVVQPASAFTVIASHTNAGCTGATGTITLIESGGTTPYSAVTWSGGLSGTNPVNVPAGTYTYSVTDANNCLATGSVIVSASGLAIADSVFNVTCNGAADGRIAALAYGGTAPYHYLWTSGDTTYDQAHLVPGSYQVTATDAGGCSVTFTGYITEPVVLSISVLSVTNVSCHAGIDGSACVSAVGGTPGYHYMWSPMAQTTSCAAMLSAGSNSVSVYDANGCTATTSLSIQEPTQITIVPTITSPTCGASNGSICTNVTGGASGSYTYVWSTGSSMTGCLLGIAAGGYALSVTDVDGCTATLIDTLTDNGTTCVWPGDADNNLLVDNNDLLPIGLGYDSAGPARAVTSIVWQGNQATDWAQSFSSYTPAVNYKYADCNGDGTINATDTAAITQNFALTHSKTITQKPWRTGDPALYPLLSKDTVTNGDTLTVDIHLGDVSLTANNVYGIAYTINYNPIVLDTTKTTFAYGASWLGGTSELLSISRDIPAQGMIKTAVTRIDHTTRSGSGIIAHLRAIVTTDNIDGKDLSYYPVHIFISDVRAVDQLGNVIQINEGTDSSEVGYTPLGIPDMTTGSLSVYPNPAHDKLYFTSSHTALQSAELINTLGEIVATYSWSDARGERTADVSGLSSGIYYIRLNTTTALAVRKITITH